MTDSALSLAAEAITDRPLLAGRISRLATVEDIIRHVRKGTISRVGFAGVMALFSSLVLSPLLAWSWFAFIATWELAARLFLEDKLVRPAAARSEDEGSRWLSAVHFIGATAYVLFPVLVWSTGEALGMVLATAWICSSANHLFVYFSANRLLLMTCAIPLWIAAMTAPFMAGGMSQTAAVGAAALAFLILAAGLFGFDRNVLLKNLAKQAAARAAAEQANADKSRFLATMSHELKTPLNAVIGYAELIEEEAEKGAVADDAAKIRGSARQLLGVIDTILDLSKLESGAVELQRERIEAAAVLEHLREVAPALAAPNNNTLTIEEMTPLGEADIDHRRVHQCLMQLLTNAAKFTRDGAIKITARRNGRELVFEVADTGIGISPERQAEIFDPFVQVEDDTARRYEGAGLGLTLVRRLAQLMGGDVTCVSAPGEGSVFTLRIDAGTA